LKGWLRWPVVAWLLLIATCAAIVSRTEFTTDLSAFLPRSPSPAQQVLVDQLRDGIVSRLILIGIDGASDAVLAAMSRKTAAQLRADDRWVSVDNGEDTAFEKDREFLWRNRYVLSPAVAPDRFSVAGIRERLEEALQLLASPAGLLVQRILPSDPTGEMLVLLETLSGQNRPELREGVWFSKDGGRALLVAQTRARGYDIDAQEQGIRAIRAAFEKARTESDEARGAKLLLSGPGVFAVSARERIKGDATRISLFATLLVATLLLAVYRSVRLLGLALIPVASGVLAGIGAVSVAFGSVHGVTLGFGATLIGEGVDYAIYLFTQREPGIAPRAALARIWPTLRLGVLTSICGFSAMLFSSFTGLAQLGLFSIAGLVVAAWVTRYVLPGLLPASLSTAPLSGLGTRLMPLIARAPVLRIPSLVLIAGGIAAVVASNRAIWTHELSNLSPISRAEQHMDEQLRRELGAPDVRHLIVITAPTQEAALESCERLAGALREAVQHRLLERYEYPALYLPSAAKQRERQAAIPTGEMLRRNLHAAVEGLPFRADVFQPFLDDAGRAKAAPSISREALQGTKLLFKVDALLVPRANEWVAMMPLTGVQDLPALKREVTAITPDPVVLDVKAAADELYQAYLREAIRNAILGALAIVILLFVALRSARRVLDVTIPLLAAVAFTASAIVLAGTALSIFHLVGLLLVVAVGSNYSLFFERQAASAQARERTIVSLLLANVSTVIGFGMLSLSSVPILHAIGTTVGIGAVLSLVFAAVFSSDSRSAPSRATAA
jgi:predicted exporter